MHRWDDEPADHKSRGPLDDQALLQPDDSTSGLP